MRQPEGFEPTFNRAALTVANSQAQGNIAAINTRMNSEQSAVEAYKAQEAFLRSSNPVPLERLKQVCDLIAAKKAAIAEFQKGIATLQQQQQMNTLYIEYLDFLQTQKVGA
jgi:hypothetical protein